MSRAEEVCPAVSAVLFVDDEPLLLGGLVRSLRLRLPGVAVLTARSGEEALRHLRANPVDVVVSDLRVGGMDGVALLDRVQQEFPSTDRLVLTGQASSAASLRAVRVAHQVLVKPVDAADLAMRLKATLEARRRWATTELMAVVSGADVLPSQDGCYAELLAEVQRERASMRRIGEIVASDAALAGKVLQVVNSAFSGLGRRIDHPVEAAAYLGVNTMCALVASSEMRRALDGRLPRAFPNEAVNDFGVLCASLARRASPGGPDDAAFTAGLLQDIGLLVLGCVEPDQTLAHLRVAQQSGRSLAVVERDCWGFTHADAGACLLGLWAIPQPVIDAVAAHHAPAPSTGASSTLSALLAARRIAGQDPHEPRPEEGPA
jgi:HD-like signal output (HDOD) protein